MAQDLTMMIRVDADLWKQFVRAAEKVKRPAEEVVVDFMRDFAATAEPVNLDLFDFASGPELTANDQFDLEDYLNVAQ